MKFCNRMILVFLCLQLFFAPSIGVGNVAVAADHFEEKDVVATAKAVSHKLYLINDGTVWANGFNLFGQLGNGTISNESILTPELVKGVTEVTAISASLHSMALKKDGTVWAWGFNGYGQIGDGTTENELTPVQVQGIDEIAAISASLHSLALKKDGTVWAWGMNDHGQVGDGTDSNQTTPVRVQGLTDVKAISAGNKHSLILKKDGTVWAWGSNEYGELGIGTNEDQWQPVQVPGLTNVTEITTIDSTSRAIQQDGTVWEWGDVKVVDSHLDTYSTLTQWRVPTKVSTSAALLPGHTKQQILDRWMALRPTYTDSPYTEQPKLTSPQSPGKLAPGFIRDGINMANFARYLSGLPDDLVGDEGLNAQAQYGASLLAVRDQSLSHYPEKPEGLDQTFYEIGYTSTSSSNLALGPIKLNYAVQLYMSDSDDSNVYGVGHRRWIQNPVLKKIGFGLAQSATNVSYSTMQILDQSRAEPVDYDFYGWPNQGSFPLNMFNANDAWSINLNPQHYGLVEYDPVKVTLTRTYDGRTWTFDSGNQSNAWNYVYSYGSLGIIFRPDNLKEIGDGDQFRVTVTGLKNNYGQSLDLSYTVNFFELDERKDYSAKGTPDGIEATQAKKQVKIIFNDKKEERWVRYQLGKLTGDIYQGDLDHIGHVVGTPAPQNNEWAFLDDDGTLKDDEARIDVAGSSGSYIKLTNVVDVRPTPNDPIYTVQAPVTVTFVGDDLHFENISAIPDNARVEFARKRYFRAGNMLREDPNEPNMYNNNLYVTHNYAVITEPGVYGVYAAPQGLSSTVAIIEVVKDGAGKPSVPSAAKTADPTAAKVLINGKQVAFDAYNIDGNNYFKLRDLAMALNGTDKNFQVGWDSVHNTISLESGQAYTPAGGELAVSAQRAAKKAAPTSSQIYFNGKQLKLTAYGIDGYNYFKLRDLAQAVNFGVTWDGNTNMIGIDTKADYSE